MFWHRKHVHMCRGGTENMVSPTESQQLELRWAQGMECSKAGKVRRLMVQIFSATFKLRVKRCIRIQGTQVKDPIHLQLGEFSLAIRK